VAFARTQSWLLGRLSPALGAALAASITSCGRVETAQPEAVSSTGGATLAASSALTCARFSDDVCCWGLYEASSATPGMPAPKPTRVALPSVPEDLAVLGANACAVVAGEVWCWSYTAQGTASLQRVDGLHDVIRISGQTGHGCALRRTGTVSCWGNNSFGQSGGGAPGTTPLPPSDVAGLNDVVELATGDWHSCARTGSGEVWCWGMGYPGEGCPVYACSSTPVAVVLPARAVHLGAGGLESCAKTEDGSVYCWHVEVDRITTPAVIPALAQVDEVQPGYMLGCALASDRQPLCWGSYDGSRLDYQPLPGFDGIVEYASGYFHACGRSESGKLSCFGANDFHQLGDGTTQNAAAPGPEVSCD
jgi:hypothetical protein